MLTKWRIEVKESIISVWYIEAPTLSIAENIYKDCGVSSEPTEVLYEDGYKITQVKSRNINGKIVM